MSEPKWTPGPWLVDHYRIGERHYSRIARDTPPLSKIVVDLDRWFLTEDIGCAEHTEDEANARLIAAAPDLYEALVAVTDTYWGVNDDRNGDGGDPPSMIVQARAALAKARGETP